MSNEILQDRIGRILYLLDIDINKLSNSIKESLNKIISEDNIENKSDSELIGELERRGASVIETLDAGIDNKHEQEIKKEPSDKMKNRGLNVRVLTNPPRRNNDGDHLVKGTEILNMVKHFLLREMYNSVKRGKKEESEILLRTMKTLSQLDSNYGFPIGDEIPEGTTSDDNRELERAYL